MFFSKSILRLRPIQCNCSLHLARDQCGQRRPLTSSACQPDYPRVYVQQEARPDIRHNHPLYAHGIPRGFTRHRSPTTASQGHCERMQSGLRATDDVFGSRMCRRSSAHHTWHKIMMCAMHARDNVASCSHSPSAKPPAGCPPARKQKKELGESFGVPGPPKALAACDGLRREPVEHAWNFSSHNNIQPRRCSSRRNAALSSMC